MAAADAPGHRLAAAGVPEKQGASGTGDPGGGPGGTAGSDRPGVRRYRASDHQYGQRAYQIYPRYGDPAELPAEQR